MTSLSAWRDVARRSFWLPAAIGLMLGVVLGVALPALDRAVMPEFGLLGFNLGEPDAARGILETIAAATITVAGVTFSATLVALVLASQQLGPRVLRTFQTDRLSQMTFAVFLATFVYCLLVLAAFDVGEGDVPRVSVTLAIVAAVAAVALFAAFVHNIVISLQASTLIRRIAADGQRAVAVRFPAGVGRDPDDPAAALEEARTIREAATPAAVRSPRAGFVVGVDGARLMELARGHDALVVQRVPIGDFALHGERLAEVWTTDADAGLLDDLAGAFHQADQRTVVQDVAFPIRQLADVALRGLSPSLNDPTTSENAMGSLANTLVRVAERPPGTLVRVDDHGRPRFVAAAPDLDALVRLGFDQVRTSAVEHPVMSMRLLKLLREIERAARDAGQSCHEPQRQARLLAEGTAGSVTTGSDERGVTRAAAAVVSADDRRA